MEREERLPNDPTVSPLWPADSPAVTAHINLLQGIINRLANNSASCKTWCLTLVAAFLSLAGATHVSGIVTFALVPVIVFGFLDAMYLAQERAYRELYRKCAEAIHKKSYTLDCTYDARAEISVGCFFWALLSWSVFPIYFGLIVAYLIAYRAGWLAVLTVTPK
jgi:hypothetical protein